MSEVQKADAEVSELGTVSEQIKEQESAAKQESVVDSLIPEKYRGKSTKELVDELETANKNMGRYSNELGEVRRLADELIKSQLHKPKEQEVSREVDIFENPQEAIKRAIESNPVVLDAAKYAEQAKQEIARQRLLQLHPDALEIAQDEKFKTWTDKSVIKKELLNRAHVNFDVDAAHELFSMYKLEQQANKVAVSETEKAARDKTMNAASVDTGGTGERSREIIKRAEIMKIMLRDPAKYRSPAFQEKIMLAYLEGRVK